MTEKADKSDALTRRTASTALKMVWRLRRTLGKPGDYLLVACMPKSGSTFLTNVVAELSGYSKNSLTYAYMQSEQDLYLPKLIDAWSYPCVTQQHVRATAANLDLIRRFSIRPMVLLRNVFDVVVSLRDHIHRESEQNPIFYTPAGFFDMDEARQFDCIIELGIPWYLGFIASWNDAQQNAGIDLLQVTYEDLIADKPGVIADVMQHFGLPRTSDEIATVLERIDGQGRNRLNKGVAGRGIESLTSEQRGRIEEMASFYSHVDFTPVGINP